VNAANEFVQLQMDDASYCPDRTFHACDCQLGKDFMSSSVNIGLAALPLDPQTKAQSSSKGWTLLLLAQFQETRVQCVHPWLHPYLPGFLYT